MSNLAPLEGLLALNKPSGISSADALRKLQYIFQKSPIFAETLQQERDKRDREGNRQQKKRRGKKGSVQVKIGHGGTLDPMATGVLVAGIGGATKVLGQFISCKKTYEAVALFGCSTDTYDSKGKILRRAPHQHITRGAVEEALGAFQGDIMQKPPIYSALHHEGKRFYEYAREGKPLPIEIKARPVTVDLMELVDFTTDHTYKFPNEDASEEEKVVGQALLEQTEEVVNQLDETLNRALKRLERDEPELTEPDVKRRKPEDNNATTAPTDTDASSTTPQESSPAAITIRMTVSSGFYVRSLIHDLGETLGSAAHMVKLVRTQQGQFELGKNVVEWEDITNKDRSVWESKVEDTLRAWAAEHPGRKPHHDGRANGRANRKLERSSGRTESSDPGEGSQSNAAVETPDGEGYAEVESGTAAPTQPTI